jgi:5-formyltetrahydrofolate cyclo-ligase
MNNAKEALRARLRAQRRALSADDRREAAAALRRQLLAWPAFRTARSLASYLPHNGELDPRTALAHALASGKRCYLPVLRGRGLIFARYGAGTSLRRNVFGIPEPLATETVPAARLDLILAPLVAFTRSGTRLGMGGGYYDATLNFLRTRRGRRRPLFAGIAYAFQEVEMLPADEWDVPLHAVITELGVIEIA